MTIKPCRAILGRTEPEHFGAVRVLSKQFGAVRVLSKMDANPNHLRRKLTELIAKTATMPSGKRQFILWDSDVVGFGLRCLAGGAKTWIYVYRPDGAGRGISSQT